MEQTLGKRIVSHRKRLGLTQDQLAEQLGVTAQAVSKWENDQSCPDISVLPRLADIFGISTDALLGRCVPAISKADPQAQEKEQSPRDNIWDLRRKGGLGLAILVLAVGILYLFSDFLFPTANFWDILWPTALFVIGLMSLIHQFSFFSLGIALAGSYFFVVKLVLSPFGVVEWGLLLKILIIYFGIALLVDTLRKGKKSHMRCHNFTGEYNSAGNNYEPGETSFRYSGSFGENHQRVALEKLEWGDISTSFGEYTLDLSGVEAVSDNANISASCSFGQLNILVPRRFAVKPVTSTAFAGFTVEGRPDDATVNTIQLNCKVSFGEIKLIYI